MNHWRIYYLIWCFTLIIVGCSDNKRTTTETIPQETFIRLYIDLLIAGENGLLSSTDTAKTAAASKFIDSLYSKYGVTDSQVRETMEEYNKDLHRWKGFYDEVMKRLEAMQKEELSKKQL